MEIQLESIDRFDTFNIVSSVDYLHLCVSPYFSIEILISFSNIQLIQSLDYSRQELIWPPRLKMGSVT